MRKTERIPTILKLNSKNMFIQVDCIRIIIKYHTKLFTMDKKIFGKMLTT